MYVPAVAGKVATHFLVADGALFERGVLARRRVCLGHVRREVAFARDVLVADAAHELDLLVDRFDVRLHVHLLAERHPPSVRVPHRQHGGGNR